MSEKEYFSKALPTSADFAAWTSGLFARADALNARLVRAYPHLFKTQAADGLPLGE